MTTKSSFGSVAVGSNSQFKLLRAIFAIFFEHQQAVLA
jgi:hypothetical protein